MSAMRLVISFFYLLITTSLHASLLKDQISPHENSYKSGRLDRVLIRPQRLHRPDKQNFNEMTLNDCCLGMIDATSQYSKQQRGSCKCNNRQISKRSKNNGFYKAKLPINDWRMLQTIKGMLFDRNFQFGAVNEGSIEPLILNESFECSSHQCQVLKKLLLFLKLYFDGAPHPSTYQNKNLVNTPKFFYPSKVHERITKTFKSVPEVMTSETKKSNEDKNDVWITRGRRSKLERLHKKLEQLLQQGAGPTQYYGDEVIKKDDDEGNLWIVRG